MAAPAQMQQTQTRPAPVVPIIVVSDFNCPWCYVAHKEIQSALARVRKAYPSANFHVQYRPFELDPTLPAPSEKPMCKVACYKAKFGEKKMSEVCRVLKERGQQVGIDFHFAGKTRQTTNAHRLVLKALLLGGEQAQIKMIDAIFAAYFERETDIGCKDYLSAAAESSGLMTYSEARSFIESEHLKDEVNLLIHHSTLREIKGVPFTIIANQWAIQGAETADSFYRAFEYAFTQAVVAPPPYPTGVSNLVTPAGLTQSAASCGPTNPGAIPNNAAPPTSPVGVPSFGDGMGMERAAVAV